nr:N-acetyl-gamma-glutamyl-phosphate reductase [Lachnospiraceae bacterium]
EIEEQLSEASGEPVRVVFTPHLAPMNRGILVTAYAALSGACSDEELRRIYEKHYGNEMFIRLLPEGVYPETRWVEGSNYYDISVRADERTGHVIVMAALDNLVKGAAGQAVQNMNLLFGLPENEGLSVVPLFP